MKLSELPVDAQIILKEARRQYGDGGDGFALRELRAQDLGIGSDIKVADSTRFDSLHEVSYDTVLKAGRFVTLRGFRFTGSARYIEDLRVARGGKVLRRDGGVDPSEPHYLYGPITAFQHIPFGIRIRTRGPCDLRVSPIGYVTVAKRNIDSALIVQHVDPIPEFDVDLEPWVAAREGTGLRDHDLCITRLFRAYFDPGESVGPLRVVSEGGSKVFEWSMTPQSRHLYVKIRGVRLFGSGYARSVGVSPDKLLAGPIDTDHDANFDEPFMLAPGAPFKLRVSVDAPCDFYVDLRGVVVSSCGLMVNR